MTPEDTNTTSKVCPTCGTRLSENATRCLVCGRTFTSVPAAAGAGPAKTVAVQSPRMPEITLSLPIAIGLMVLILAIGAAVVFFVLRGTQPAQGSGEGLPVAAVEATATVTVTPTITFTPTNSPTPTEMATPTPLPPVDYTIQSGDVCAAIAFNHNVSVNSITSANPGLDCALLVPGRVIKVPQPTPTATAAPTGTLSAMDATSQACQTVDYQVKDGDTLQGIANAYNVSMESIKEYNGLTSDVVFSGAPLRIPLCERRPTAGPTPTATNPPPYNPANLLLPADGAAFTAANDSITLQWAAVGTLRQNETYRVTIEDITEGKGRKLVDYVSDTKYIVPVSFRPVDNIPHVIRWIIVPVRQVGSSEDGQAIYEPAGLPSAPRDFTWWIASGSGPATTPTP